MLRSCGEMIRHDGQQGFVLPLHRMMDCALPSQYRREGLRFSLFENRARFPGRITELSYVQVILNKNLIIDVDLRIFVQPLFELFGDLS